MPSISLSSGTQMWYNVPTEPSGANKPDLSRPVLFFIHANCTDGRQWHHQVEEAEMAQNFTMITTDLPFCGLTKTPFDWQPGAKAAVPKPSGQKPNICFEKQAEDVAELIGKLDLPKIHLVSLGPNTAIAYILLLRFPDLFKSSTFMSPSSLQETADSRAGFVEIWKSMVNGCPEELEEATWAYYSLFFGHWSMRDLVRRERWFKMWACYMPTLESRRFTFGEWMTAILERKPIGVEELRRGINFPVLVCSGSDAMIHPTAHDELDAVFASPGTETACPYYETHRLGNAALMIAKTHFEEINSILGHFVCAVEGIELKPPSLELANQGWNQQWQDPYLALEKRLEAIQSGRYTYHHRSSASLSDKAAAGDGQGQRSTAMIHDVPILPLGQPVVKKKSFLGGLRGLANALNASSTAH